VAIQIGCGHAPAMTDAIASLAEFDALFAANVGPRPSSMGSRFEEEMSSGNDVGQTRRSGRVEHPKP